MAVKGKTIIERVVAGEKSEPADPQSIIGKIAAANAEISKAGRDRLAAELADERSYDGIPEIDKKRLFPKALGLVKKYEELALDPVKNERSITFVVGDLKEVDHELHKISDFYDKNSGRIEDLMELAGKLGKKGLAKDLAGLKSQLDGMKRKPFFGKVTELDELRREKFENYLHKVQEELEAISERETGDRPRFD